MGVVAASLNAYGFWIYNKQVFQTTSTPNPASWLVWSALGVINTSSYLMGTRDWVISLQFFVGTIGCTATFLYAWKVGKFDRLQKTERRVLVLSGLAMVVWFFTSAAWANYVILIAFLIAFWSTFTGIWKNPYKESPLPWFIWGLVFAIVLTNAALRWNGQPVALINPAVLMISHLIVVPLCNQRRKTRFVNKDAT